jgi:hypothetical protein
MNIVPRRVSTFCGVSTRRFFRNDGLIPPIGRRRRCCRQRLSRPWPPWMASSTESRPSMAGPRFSRPVWGTRAYAVPTGSRAISKLPHVSGRRQHIPASPAIIEHKQRRINGGGIDVSDHRHGAVVEDQPPAARVSADHHVILTAAPVVNDH